MELKMLKLKEIECLQNIRDKVDKTDLKELAASIKEIGLIHPVTVRKNGKGYQLIAGNRRLMAFELNKVDEIPGIIVTAGDDEIKSIQIIENIQRKDLNIIEEAKALDQMLKDRNCTVKDAAAIIGKTVKYVLEHRQLVNLIAYYQAQLLGGTLKLDYAFRVARLEKSIQERLQKEHQHIEYFENRFIDLTKAPFKLDDETLTKTAPKCTECPKNTGTRKDLFGNLGKGDFCTDDECFGKKCAGLIQNKVNQLKTAGESVIVVRESYGDFYSGKDEYVKYDKKAHKKFEPVKAVISETHDYKNLGKVVQVIPKKKTVRNEDGTTSKTEVAKPKQDPDERYWRKIDLITFLETEQIVLHLCKTLINRELATKPVAQNEVRIMFSYLLDGISHSEKERFLKLTGTKVSENSWDYDKVIIKMTEGMNTEGLLNFYLLFSLISKINTTQPEMTATSKSIPDLYRVAKLQFSTDPEELRKKISGPYDEQRLKAHTRFVEKHGREPKKKK